MTTNNAQLPEELTAQAEAINAMIVECHGRATRAGWYRDPKTGAELAMNVGEKLALVHSEVSEALEGHRKNKMDDHLPDRRSVAVELADAVIRIFDLAGALSLDLGYAYAHKLRYNETRADHKPEARAAGGKAY
jgi:NTP pyrophosphatase (non-canonical NTP hydrolase)